MYIFYYIYKIFKHIIAFIINQMLQEQNSTELLMLSVILMLLLKIIFLSFINSFIKYLTHW